MNELWERLSGAWATRIAAAGAVAGGAAGGGVYLSLSGILLGIITVLGVLGMLGVLSSAIAAITGAGEPRPALAAVPATATAAAVTASGGPGPATPSGPVVQSTVPAAAGVAPIVEEVTRTEAELLASGRFAEYHLAKAKRLYAGGNMKEAAYQAGASIAHGDLPEAVALRKTALAAGH